MIYEIVAATESNFCFFFFNVTATTEIYTYRHTLSLHDALPISRGECAFEIDERGLELGKRVHQTRHAIGMLEYGCLLVARLGINEAHLWQANRKSVHAATRRRLIRELKHSLAGLAARKSVV